MNYRSVLRKIGHSVWLSLLAAMLIALPAMAEAGTLEIVKGQPNPTGVLEELYLIRGDAYSGPVNAIKPGKGVTLPKSELTGDRDIKLTLFHFNDLHNNLTIPHAKKGDTHIFSQMYQIVNKARESAGPDEVALFVSAGDDHTGAVLDELVGWDETSFVMSPAYRIYSAAGLDAAVIGNHELDRGAAILRKAITQDARFPLLSANLHGSAHLTVGDYSSAALGVSKGLRIGFIGLTTPVDTHTGEVSDPELAVAGPIATVNNILPALAEISDVVIILSHVGFGEAAGAADRYIVEGDVALARAVSKLTDKPVIIVGGHTHTALNQDGLTPETIIDGIPILQAGGKAKFLGEFNTIISEGNRKNGMNDFSARLIALKMRDDRVQPDDPKYAGLEHDGDYDAAFENRVIEPIMAKLKNRLDQPIAKIKDEPAVGREQTIADRYIGESVLANFMNDAVVARSATFPDGRVDIALFNASGVNAGIPTQGELTFADWYNVMPFADTIQVGEMTGQQIKDMLVNNAKRLVRPEDLKADPPVDLNGYVSRGFLHFSGAVRYTIELNDSATEATATDITLNGKPIDDVLDKTFVVAFNSYVGAGAYGESWNGNPIGAGVKGDIIGYDLKNISKHDTGLVYRNEIVLYIREQGVVSPETGAKKDGRLVVVE
jgi:5'-nucleotidase / UDP-sugar diphosphatase